MHSVVGGNADSLVERKVCGIYVDLCVVSIENVGRRRVSYVYVQFFFDFFESLVAKSRSFLVNAAFIIVLIRALSRATIGKTIGSANTPSSKSLALSFLAIPLSPTITGVMGVSLLSMLKPRSFEFC